MSDLKAMEGMAIGQKLVEYYETNPANMPNKALAMIETLSGGGGLSHLTERELVFLQGWIMTELKNRF